MVLDIFRRFFPAFIKKKKKMYKKNTIYTYLLILILYHSLTSTVLSYYGYKGNEGKNTNMIKLNLGPNSKHEH